MYTKLIAPEDDVEPAGSNCWGFGFIPDPGSPGGICCAGWWSGL